jgi:hypothetical protein
MKKNLAGTKYWSYKIRAGSAPPFSGELGMHPLNVWDQTAESI